MLATGVFEAGEDTMKAIHTELAGGQCMLSNNYYIEKHGPCHGGGLHHGGFPKMRTFHYGYDHTTSKFDCYSTKATIILSDMSTIEKGPFACIPGETSPQVCCLAQRMHS